MILAAIGKFYNEELIFTYEYGFSYWIEKNFHEVVKQSFRK